jgi:uncharacterized protein YtpQ (UPF0354 family)
LNNTSVLNPLFEKLTGGITIGIPYKEITSISPTKDIFTGYRILSSMDALEIAYKSAFMGSVKISPQKKELFIAQIKKRCPHA